jgi:DNA-binding NtrC family response regulator
MMGQGRFLLINGSRDHYWHAILEAAIAPLGVLQIGMEQDTAQLVRPGSFDLLIVDAAAVENIPVLLGRLRARQPDARIIVATASPTWRRAREAFQAGASDYIRKSVDLEEIRTAIQNALEITLLR